MKKILILVLTVVSYSCKAQLTVPMNTDYKLLLKNNNYIKDTEGDLNKFVGTWKWIDPNNPNTYMELEFFKVLHWNANNINEYYEDSIFGNYKYVQNGVVITNTLGQNSTDDLYNYNLFPKISSYCRKPLFKDLAISMSDVEKHKTCQAMFEILDLEVQPLQANWRMYVDEQIIYKAPGDPAVIPGFTLPNDVVLTKITPVVPHH